MALTARKKPPLPKLYSDVNKSKPKEYWDYGALKVQWGKLDDYEIDQKIGTGKYSEVYSGVHTPTNRKCVIKVLKPVRKAKVKREIKILQHLSKGPNIVSLWDVVCDPLTKTPCLVFECVNNTNWKTLYPSFSRMDVRRYLFQILKALDYCHSQGLMHRDVKPQNIMIDHAKKEVRLIDWGLAEFYHPHQEYNVRVASRYYKGPELLIDDRLYHYSLDMWSLGCWTAAVAFKEEPFFCGEDNNDQLVKIAKVLGTDSLHEYVNAYGLNWNPEVAEKVGIHPRMEWTSFANAGNKDRVCPEIINLMDMMLRYDPAARVLPKEAMEHAFFEPLQQQK